MIGLALLLFQVATEPATRSVSAEIGSKMFAASCAAGYCHGPGGAANRGPRLRGRLFERSYVDRIVRRGIPNSAMPGFESVMEPGELEAVIAHVMQISADVTRGDPSVTSGIERVMVQATPVAGSGSPGEVLFFDGTREVR